ncbi:DUF6228 family protein [Burkholderia dolosa]|uniref:Uncharacterized protein n=2 Tax=Burkholderia dolosa TaxID=152500 RepID=A0A892IFQ2_9BURK|nr:MULTISPECIES: DUF6228 family protein [Burkholderia]MBR8416416.1 hypothetical protein [Burkholderia dolosa]MBY4656085.1 DUF6228 family protein [Burkholderia dolosa]MBY4689790.1 DUF6228 family protein [Burkholderia dolosa]MBY4780004.1 DUF6228 family protein [Burkholderia dolosa]MBY4785672.1 DUF6228 family protein [Burkholderia dolosa]
MNVVEIKSCESQTTLSLSLYSGDEDEVRFLATISGAPFTGEILASTYVSGPPTALFDAMAASWTGWSGPKCWHAIDGELPLTATTTSLGKVTLIVEMRAASGDYTDTATATLKLEAGSLDRIADDVRSLFSA